MLALGSGPQKRHNLHCHLLVPIGMSRLDGACWGSLPEHSHEEGWMVCMGPALKGLRFRPHLLCAMQENDLKRQRALRREKEEAAIRRQKEVELEAFQAEMREVRYRACHSGVVTSAMAANGRLEYCLHTLQVDDQRNRLRGLAVKLRVYDDHLFAVSAAAPDSYPEIADVMKRNETLVSANNVRPSLPLSTEPTIVRGTRPSLSRLNAGPAISGREFAQGD